MTTAHIRPADTDWRLPVLMYHSITASAAEAAATGGVPRQRLAEQLGALAADGWALVGLTEALDLLDREPTRRVLGLTFDDGLLDFRNAVEELRRIGARATLYVPTALVGRPGRTLDWAQLREVSDAGVEIGSHSCRHRPLDVLPAATVAVELRDSRAALQDRLGVAVSSFSYPHGYTSAAVTAAVRDAGYRNACVVGRRIARGTDDRFTVPRLEARPGDTERAVRELVRAGEPGLAPMAKRALTPAWRLARRGAFTLFRRELT